MPTSIHDRVEQERKRALPEAHRLKDFRNYARGRQKGTLTPYQMHILRGLLGNRFCDNICKKILGELRNRLKLARFDVDSTEVLTFLRDLWVKNKIPRLASAVHWASLRDGNTAIGLQYTDRVILTRERWWNGKWGFFIAYDDNDEPTYAVKDWKSGDDILRTVWFPDHIERYIATGAKGWTLRKLEGDPDTGFPQWVDSAGQPLGIPFVHFANLQVPNDGPGDDSAEEPDAHYGVSELDGGVLGLQDEINEGHRDLTAAARFVGFPMMKGTGITATRNPVTGEESDVRKFRPEPGAMFTDVNPEADFDMIPAGDLSQLEKYIAIKLQAVSRQSSIPMHLITGDWPSGEALLRSEMPMIDKVETIGTSFGPAWSTIGFKAVKLANAFGGESLDQEALITSVFEAASKRDPLTQAIVAEKLAPFVSVAETLRTLGKSESEVTKIIAEMIDEIKKGVPRSNFGQREGDVRPSEAGGDLGRSPTTRADGGISRT